MTTESKLKHFTDSNGLCRLCELEPEDEIHVLIECDSLGEFWCHIIKTLKSTIDVNFQVNDLILICPSGLNLSEYIIIEEAKWLVWRRRCLIRYENVWVTDVQMLVRLKNRLTIWRDVLYKSRYGDQETVQVIKQMTLFVDGL